MATLEDALRYILQTKLKKVRGVSPNQLIRILYLADWKSSIKRKHPITDINWKIINSEPQLDKESIERIINLIERNGRTLRVGVSATYRKIFIEGLSSDDEKILDFVIGLSDSESEEALAQLVYSTYPSMTKDSGDQIDLPALARKYEKLQPILSAN